MIQIKIETSVIIIGAGPAGASTSIFLTKSGIHHIIIEKENFPRDKVCGDACSGKTAFVLRKANPQWLQEIFEQQDDFLACHGCLFMSENARSISIPFNQANIKKGQAPGFIATRLLFDNFLFTKLPSDYSTIFQHAVLKTIERTKDGNVKVCFEQDGKMYEIKAPFIVGADGDKSLVRKNLLKKYSSPKANCVALRAYYKGVTGLHKQNFMELHYMKEILPGYFWIFPLPNGMANVGVGILSNTIRKKKINLREVMLHAIKHNPEIKDRFANAVLTDKIQGWGLPMGIKRLPVSGNNFLLTGDAASLIDPFSGEGIGNAMYSGMLAAQAIEKSLLQKKYDAVFLKKYYDDVLYSKIGDELKVSAMLQRVCHYPWLLRFVINKAHKSATLNKAISNMFTGVDLRRQLLDPLFYARVIFNR